MKILKSKRRIMILGLVLIAIISGGVTAGLMLSNSDSDSASAAESQIATVQRGDLSIDITAAGNLALSLTEDLAVDLFYQEGTVAEVLVEEGDTVTEGQVLVKLDASEWADNLSTLETQVVEKERDQLQAKINLKNAQLSLENAKEPSYSTQGSLVSSVDPLDIEIKELQVKLAESRLEDADEALTEAQEELDEALNSSPEITAPFAGFITQVNVSGGDEVKTGTVAVQLADPDKFEAEIMVSEMDIMNVELGGEAWVQVDAVTGLNLPAEVTHISPTATIQSGVVNYAVKVELQSLDEMAQKQQEARQEMMEDTLSGELPETIQQAITEGEITQEQAEEMMEMRQPGTGGEPEPAPAATFESFQLRDGLTVTVSITVDESNDVLLVPNGAITNQGWQTCVQVLSPDGTIEERSITTGLSDWQYTEVTEGLSEGEQVVVTQGTTTTTTSFPQEPTTRIMIPGMGRP